MKRPKNASDRHKQKTVSFRLPQPLTARLRALAKRNRRTLSGEAQLALEIHLAANGLLRTDAKPG
jgi:predicted DNA-binding protein